MKKLTTLFTKQLRVMIEIHHGSIKISKNPRKNQACKSCLQSNESLQFLNQFQFLQTKLNSLIEESKEKHYVRLSKKLLDPQTSPKSYWSILKTFLNNKKISCIPPLLHQNKSAINFKDKAEMFNNFSLISVLY